MVLMLKNVLAISLKMHSKFSLGLLTVIAREMLSASLYWNWTGSFFRNIVRSLVQNLEQDPWSLTSAPVRPHTHWELQGSHRWRQCEGSLKLLVANTIMEMSGRWASDCILRGAGQTAGCHLDNSECASCWNLAKILAAGPFCITLWVNLPLPWFGIVVRMHPHGDCFLL